jgi:alpha-N-arabinofuranosidase
MSRVLRSMFLYEVNDPDIKAENDFDKTTVITTKKADIRASGQKVTYSFAPHFFTMLKGKLNK